MTKRKIDIEFYSITVFLSPLCLCVCVCVCIAHSMKQRHNDELELHGAIRIQNSDLLRALSAPIRYRRMNFTSVRH